MENGDIVLVDAVANQIYERHQIIMIISYVLGVDRDIATEDACKIEHVIARILSKDKIGLKRILSPKHFVFFQRLSILLVSMLYQKRKPKLWVLPRL